MCARLFFLQSSRAYVRGVLRGQEQSAFKLFLPCKSRSHCSAFIHSFNQSINQSTIHSSNHIAALLVRGDMKFPKRCGKCLVGKTSVPSLSLHLVVLALSVAAAFSLATSKNATNTTYCAEFANCRGVRPMASCSLQNCVNLTDMYVQENIPGTVVDAPIECLYAY